MKPYTEQELEACGLFSRLFSKPANNAWKEINNLLAACSSADEISAAQAKAAAKKWGAKFDDASAAERSAVYRPLAERAFREAAGKNDPLFSQCAHLAEILQLTPHQVKNAEKAAKTAAYFARCRALIHGEEKLDINTINELFGYDYEDGLAARRQVFQNHFDSCFEDISKKCRFSPEQEQSFRDQCAALDIPYKLKTNIANVLHHYRDLWNAENRPLGDLETDLPLRSGEACRAHANCGLCRHQLVEKEDNYFEMTRKFHIDETVSFKGEKLEHPKIKEEVNAVLELGHFVLTSQRIIYISQKQVIQAEMSELSGADFDGINIITFHGSKGDYMYKFSDDAAEVMHILFNRTFEEFRKK